LTLLENVNLAVKIITDGCRWCVASETAP